MMRSRGMTLLEVLIATTILASLTLIVSTLWAQTKQWTEETATHDSALRLQRALDLLDRQWDARLLDATLVDGEVGAVHVDDLQLLFITTESVLFPDWPIVKVAYIAQRVSEQGSGAPRWRLQYEEVRLGVASDTDTNPDDATSLRRSILVELTERPIWSAILSEVQIDEWEASHGQALAPESSADEQQRWINLTDNVDRRWAGLEAATNPEAIRLDGVTAEGGFRWALVGQPLH